MDINVIDDINIDVKELPATNTESMSSGIEACQDTSKHNRKLRKAPTQAQSLDALGELKPKLCPPRKTGRGYRDTGLDPFVWIRMEEMQSMLHLYTVLHSSTYEKWGASAYQAAISMGHGRYYACQLAKLSRKFIEDCTVLPVNPYGDWNESMLVDEDLATDINLHLQELGSNISACKVVDFLARPDVKEKHGITKPITERAAH